jgi:hypothetical protein
MAIAVTPYTEEWTPAVAAFNRRLADGGVSREFRFPEHHVPDWLPRQPGRCLYQEFFLAADRGDVRGAFILKHQPFYVDGRPLSIAHYRLPISEGIVDRRYSIVGVQMLRTALQKQPLLFCLGMGGFDRPLPQMLKALGWPMHAVPFYFRACRPARVLRHVAPLRQTPARRFAADVAAATGIGWIGFTALQRARAKSPDRSISSTVVETFGPWADEVWARSRAAYRLIAARTSEMLNVLYAGNRPFIRIRVHRGDEVVGWAVALDTQMRDSKYFGSLRVGSIVDALAPPGKAAAVVQAATTALESRGVDLIVSNQSHRAWTAALEGAGFLHGPSNFIAAVSKPLADLLQPFDAARDAIHITRGDGDGPVNL